MTHPDDIGYARAEARQQAAEDGVMLMDEDDWDDAAFADALMDAALDERFGLPAREDAREREREAMPPVMDGLAW